MYTLTEYHVTVEQGIRLTVLLRIDETKNNPIIVFIHGFGCTKESFAHAFIDPLLDNYDLIAIDLPGHGHSSKVEEFSYTMVDLAGIVVKALDTLEITYFHLCTHSMGGLIGIEISEAISERVLSFINLEGNLTLEDCFFTRKIIKYPYEDFLSVGRERIEKKLENSVLTNQLSRSFLKSFQKTSNIALYKTAVDTVAVSDNPSLINRFINLKNRCYIYGEKNINEYPAEQILLKLNVPVYYVENAGHFMTEENPKGVHIHLKNWVDSIKY